jgi:predicted DNA-binding transcriptional regulator
MSTAEERVYELLCKKPGCTASVVGQKLNIRGKEVFIHLGSLVRRGLIVERRSKITKFYPVGFAELLPQEFRK